jgi:hypothetical protein
MPTSLKKAAAMPKSKALMPCGTGLEKIRLKEF